MAGVGTSADSGAPVLAVAAVAALAVGSVSVAQRPITLDEAKAKFQYKLDAAKSVARTSEKKLEEWETSLRADSADGTPAATTEGSCFLRRFKESKVEFIKAQKSALQSMIKLLLIEDCRFMCADVSSELTEEQKRNQIEVYESAIALLHNVVSSLKDNLNKDAHLFPWLLSKLRQEVTYLVCEYKNVLLGATGVGVGAGLTYGFGWFGGNLLTRFISASFSTTAWGTSGVVATSAALAVAPVMFLSVAIVIYDVVQYNRKDPEDKELQAIKESVEQLEKNPIKAFVLT